MMPQLAVPPTPTSARAVRSSRWAWVALVLTPPLGLLAIWMAFFVLGDENIKWWGSALVLLLAFGPPALGALLGARSAISGNHAGAHAGAVAAAWWAFWLAFWYLANYPYNSQSAAAPLGIAGAAACVASALVEMWYWRRTKHANSSTSK